VHRYSPEKKTMMPVEGSGGLSPESSEREGEEARSWSQTIWADMLV
jgi:hypothetical protein